MRKELRELLSERTNNTEIHQLFMLRERAILDTGIRMLQDLADDIHDFDIDELRRRDSYIEAIEDCILTLRQWMRETGRYDIKEVDA